MISKIFGLKLYAVLNFKYDVGEIPKFESSVSSDSKNAQANAAEILRTEILKEINFMPKVFELDK